jgi:hypothetical protein
MRRPFSQSCDDDVDLLAIAARVRRGFDDEQGDLARVAQFRLRVRLNGSDGSRLILAASGKTTTNANGDPVIERNSMTCS